MRREQISLTKIVRKDEPTCSTTDAYGVALLGRAGVRRRENMASKTGLRSLDICCKALAQAGQRAYKTGAIGVKACYSPVRSWQRSPYCRAY